MYNYIWLCKSRTRKTIYYLCIRFFYIRILQKFQALFNILALSLVFRFFFRKKSNPDAVGLIPQRTQKGTSMLFFVLCFIVCLCFWLTNVKGGSIQSTALFFFKKLHHKEKNRKIYTTEYSRDLILREYTTAVPLCVKIIFKMSRYRSPKTCAWVQFYFIEITIVNMNMKCVKRIMFLFETRGLKALTATWVP